jgi:hypothetical protein
MVTGASLALKETSTLFTEPIPLDGITASGSLSTGLDLGQPNLKLVEPGKKSVVIYYQVKHRSGPELPPTTDSP